MLRVIQWEAACAQGGTSFHGTGIEPGWAGEVLPLTMSGILRRVDSILVQEPGPEWPTGRRWRVTVEGAPSMTLDSRITVHGEDDTEQGCLGTAMHAVHAVAPVRAAEPGIRTFLDLPMIVGRGVLG